MRAGKRNVILFILVAAFFAAAGDASASWASGTVGVTLLPSERFYRSAGGPDTVLRAFTVPATVGTFTLVVDNGNGVGDSLISSAVVKVNGSTVVRPSDLSQEVTHFEKTLNGLLAKGENHMEVVVKSIPSSFITLAVKGEYLLDVTVTAPAPGTVLDSDRATVEGTWQAYTSDVGIEVNGVPAALYGNTFTANNVPLRAGTNVLTARVTAIEGISDSESLEVSASGGRPAVGFLANVVWGSAPLKVDFRPEADGIEAVEFRYDFDGDGTTDRTTTADEYVDYTYALPGLYRAGVTVIDSAGLPHQGTAVITVADHATVNNVMLGRWDNLRGNLTAGDSARAVSLFSSRTADRYREIFTRLSAKLPLISADMGGPELIGAEGGQAKYRLRRLEDGVSVTYYLYFIQDPDGLWRILQF